MSEINFLEVYCDFLSKRINVLRPLSVVFDGSGGVAGMVIKRLFANHPKIKTCCIHCTPDPSFSAHGPDPGAPHATNDIAKKIQETKADMGFVFDSDGDRVVVVDDSGVRLESVTLAELLFDGLSGPFVVDEMLFQALRDSTHRDKLIPSKVGSRFVKEAMRSGDADIGAEFSGHYYFKDFFFMDSGVLAAIFAMNIVSALSVPLSDWHSKLEKKIIISLSKTITDTQKSFRTLETAFAGWETEHRDGITFRRNKEWLNVRPSNTEPILRLTAGAESEDLAQKLLAHTESLLKV